ncbi:MAG: helix-hairpin-helix domain-containing protein [Deltaproteobacteria bacterium]
MPRRLAFVALVLATLLPAGVRRLPARERPDCEPEGRGVAPRHWVGCRGDPGAPRALSGRELVLLGRPVDLDRASVEDLEAVPGIGPGLAAEVVRDREEHGPFGRPEALRRVRGIGPVRMERARPWIRVTPP